MSSIGRFYNKVHSKCVVLFSTEPDNATETQLVYCVEKFLAFGCATSPFKFFVDTSRDCDETV